MHLHPPRPQVAQQPISGGLRGAHRAIDLVIALDTTYNAAAVKEAHAKGILTAGLVNHHKVRCSTCACTHKQGCRLCAEG